VALPTELLVAIVTLIGVVVSSIITAWVTSKANKASSDIAVKIASQQATEESHRVVNDSFKLLIETFENDRVETRKEMEELRFEIHTLSQHMVRLEEELIKNGHIVPPRPVRTKATTAL
jgi:capsular polysaccharide biosynthesis protein